MNLKTIFTTLVVLFSVIVLGWLGVYEYDHQAEFQTAAIIINPDEDVVGMPAESYTYQKDITCHLDVVGVFDDLKKKGFLLLFHTDKGETGTAEYIFMNASYRQHGKLDEAIAPFNAVAILVDFEKNDACYVNNWVNITLDNLLPALLRKREQG